MNITATQQLKMTNRSKVDIEQLKIKAAFWDEFMEFIEDKYFGYIMESAEKEKNISLSKAKKILK